MPVRRYDNSRIPGQPGGYALLLSVIIMASITITLVFSFSTLGFVALHQTQYHVSQQTARAVAFGCAERALLDIHANDFVGSSSATIAGVSCQFSVSDTGGESRLIVAESTVDSTVATVQVTITNISPQIDGVMWQMIGN